jgi:hypothetical protein
VLAFELELRALSERDEMLGVTPCHVRSFTRGIETLRRVLPDRLEHPVARSRTTDEIAVDKCLQRVELGTSNFDRGFQGPTTREDRQRREQLLLAWIEELVAPVDRRFERLLACRQIARP